MIYAILIGILLGIEKASIWISVLVVFGTAALRGVWGITFRSSRYAGYLNGLAASAPLERKAEFIISGGQFRIVPATAWLTYLGYAFFYFGGGGLVAYFLALWGCELRFWWVWCIAAYLAVGFLVAVRHLAEGKVGRQGPVITFFAASLLWPV